MTILEWLTRRQRHTYARMILAAVMARGIESRS